MDSPERLSLQSADGAQLNLDALYQIAPSCFTEAADPKTGGVKRVVNFDILRQLLGDDAVEDAPEAYEFNWVGKQAARAEVLRSISKTLRPVREDSVDWDTTQNLYIEGDNLEVLKLLQKSYLGKVKMIYIDPPYNTGNDFVYRDDFARSQAEEDLFAGNVDELGNRFIKNTDSNGRYHSDWCSMIYSRLMIARSLLTEDGVIFISIDDNEVTNLRNIGDEVFGKKNFLTCLIWNKQHSQQQGIFKRYHESVIVYAKNASIQKNIGGGEGIIEAGAQKKISKANPESTFTFPAGVRFDAKDGTCLTGTYGDSEQSTVVSGKLLAKNGKTVEEVTLSAGWTQKNQMTDFFAGKEVYDTKGQKVLEFYFNSAGKLKCTKERGKITPPSILPQYGMESAQTKELTNLMGGNYFENPKPVQMIYDFESWFLSDSDIVMDFFSGSATSAHALMRLNSEKGGNRKFILVQLPEETPEDSEAYKAGYKNICEIGKERIRRAGKKIKEENPLTTQDLDTGFRVFRVDSSNYEEVEHTPKDWNQDQLDLFLNNIKSDRTDLDLLFGCMLDWGVQLSLPMTTEEVDGKNIYTVNEGDLVACFDEKVTDNVVRAMAEKQPLRVIFRDSCFERDADKINIYETFKQLMDWSDQEVVKNIRVI